MFEILSNAIDEAREGYGDTIIVTRYEDLSVEVEDFGRGCPRGLQRKGKTLQLGAGVLRNVRRRQIWGKRGKL